MNLSRQLIRKELTVDSNEKTYLLMKQASKKIWDYFGHAGELVPWHDKNTPWWHLVPQQKVMVALFNKLKKEDIPFWAYFILIFSMSDATLWDRPGLLAKQNYHWTPMKKLRKYVGSAENMERLATVLLYFFECQIREYGRVFFKAKRVYEFDDVFYPVAKTSCNRELQGYKRLFDKLNEVEIVGGVKFETWIDMKFENCSKWIDREKEKNGGVTFRNIPLKLLLGDRGNPTKTDILMRLEDPWVEVRKFLGLSYKCQFTDGYIPKGWLPIEVDEKNLADITAVTGEGFYYRSDGSQRKGTRHYASNRYFLIKCTPDNFKFFIDDWKQKIWITQNPTWQEYSAWGAYENIWDVNGMGLVNENGMVIKRVHWRSSKKRTYEI